MIFLYWLNLNSSLPLWSFILFNVGNLFDKILQWHNIYIRRRANELRCLLLETSSILTVIKSLLQALVRRSWQRVFFISTRQNFAAHRTCENQGWRLETPYPLMLFGRVNLCIAKWRTLQWKTWTRKSTKLVPKEWKMVFERIPQLFQWTKWEKNGHCESILHTFGYDPAKHFRGADVEDQHLDQDLGAATLSSECPEDMMECAQRNVEEQQQNLGARAASSTGVCPEDVGCRNVEDQSRQI